MRVNEILKLLSESDETYWVKAVSSGGERYIYANNIELSVFFPYDEELSFYNDFAFLDNSVFYKDDFIMHYGYVQLNGVSMFNLSFIYIKNEGVYLPTPIFKYKHEYQKYVVAEWELLLSEVMSEKNIAPYVGMFGIQAEKSIVVR
ncbi:hypothetical protein SAMN04487895_101482 [Paenibacillus sophorae]|uniref:Uncharacterized protein n=1 Tax=Paenibacillus sophorae TaxID=1333845 RepID=A0A1H8GES1_9BACL|nr:hypothetical protein [Paenibacillus sophorae]QWU14192.1 hypothetical protein KP014_19970 [Paenibacillus sophorae]SEN42285.1 hypothetical protein SAMN04487895_101482 [Paenibacillus sophorae]